MKTGPGHIPRDFIELLLTKTDIVDFISAKIPLSKKSNNNYFACCPFHQEKSPSFSVSQVKQFYYCFGCHAHGNVIDFVMNHERMGFPEAIEFLARQAGMEIPRNDPYIKTEDPLPALYECLIATATFYQKHLRQSQHAIQYLKNRGISGAIAQQFGIGYAPASWALLLDHLAQTETDKKKLLQAGLIIKKAEGGYYDRFRDRIMFPIHDHRGRLIGFGGRIIDQGEPKYLNSPETPLFQKSHILYGLHQALKIHRTLNHVIIVEGYMDVIALFQHGITYAVATLGTATTGHHLTRLFRYTTEIIFCFDGDEAGRTAAWRALQIVFPVMRDSLQIRFLFLPDGEDPDSLIRKEGQALFEERLLSATSLSAFFFQVMNRQEDTTTLESRAKFATVALSYIKQLPPSLFQDMMLEELGKRTRIDIPALKKQIKHPTQKALTAAMPSSSSPTVKISPVIEQAVSLLIQYPSFAYTIEESLPNITLPGFSFFVQLIEIIKENNTMTAGAVLEYWRGKEEAQWLAQIAHKESILSEENLKQEFHGIIRQLRISAYDQEINRLLAKANQADLSEEEKIELSHWIGKKKLETS
jgi:DNA primase